MYAVGTSWWSTVFHKLRGQYVHTCLPLSASTKCRAQSRSGELTGPAHQLVGAASRCNKTHTEYVCALFVDAWVHEGTHKCAASPFLSPAHALRAWAQLPCAAPHMHAVTTGVLRKRADMLSGGWPSACTCPARCWREAAPCRSRGPQPARQLSLLVSLRYALIRGLEALKCDSTLMNCKAH